MQNEIEALAYDAAERVFARGSYTGLVAGSISHSSIKHIWDPIFNARLAELKATEQSPEAAIYESDFGPVTLTPELMKLSEKELKLYIIDRAMKGYDLNYKSYDHLPHRVWSDDTI